MNNRHRLRSAAGRLDDVLELPAGTLSGGAHIELHSNREAVVDGCKGLIDYSDSAVRLNIGCGTVTFSGRSLEIKTLSDSEAVIAGWITDISFKC